MDLRPVAAADLEAFERAAEGAFHEDAHPEDAPLAAKLFEPERSLAVFDGGRIVGTAGVYTRALTVPGGPVPAACVTAVGGPPPPPPPGPPPWVMRPPPEGGPPPGR